MKVPWQHADGYSGLHLYVIRLPQDKDKLNRREVFERLRTHGIGVNLHYIPVYRQPYYENMGFQAEYCPEAESYYRETISLPMFAALTPQDQARVVSILRQTLE